MADFVLLVNAVLLAFMAATALATIRQRNLFAVVVLSAIYSLLSAAFLLVQDAVDVSFTEASVGAGISTVLLLATLALTGNEREKPTHHRRGLALLVVLVTGVALVYGTWDMPAYGDPTAPIHTYTTPRYLQESGHEIGIPNVVTSVLASYRGYDTLGETTVILTAGIGVILLLGLRRFPRRAVRNDP
jgi:multicomponent Na+:H+ antiporter subunit B